MRYFGTSFFTLTLIIAAAVGCNSKPASAPSESSNITATPGQTAATQPQTNPALSAGAAVSEVALSESELLEMLNFQVDALRLLYNQQKEQQTGLAALLAMQHQYWRIAATYGRDVTYFETQMRRLESDPEFKTRFTELALEQLGQDAEDKKFTAKDLERLLKKR